MSPEQLYHLHKAQVYSLCLRFCGGNISLAEDLTQDVFLKMLEHIDTLSETDSLQSWLYRVTTNTCFSRMKRDVSIWKKVRDLLWFAPRETWETPEKQSQIKEELQHVSDLMETLPAKERIVFYMHYLDELSQSEICDVLNLSKGYVSKLLHRAKVDFQTGWKKEGK